MSDDAGHCPEFGRRLKCDDRVPGSDECFECQVIAAKIEAKRLGVELSSTLKRAAGSIARLGEAAEEASDRIEGWNREAERKKPKGAVARLAASAAGDIERQADEGMFDGLENSTLEGK